MLSNIPRGIMKNTRSRAQLKAVLSDVKSLIVITQPTDSLLLTSLEMSRFPYKDKIYIF